jgi:hypothetical protein
VHHPQTRYWRVSNQIRFYRRYARGGQQPLMFGFTLLRSLKLAAVDFVAGRTALAQRTLAGWRDGWFRYGNSLL